MDGTSSSEDSEDMVDSVEGTDAELAADQAVAGRELQCMSPVAREQYFAALLRDHFNILDNFDSEPLHRHALACSGASLTFKDVALTVEAAAGEVGAKRVRSTILEPCSGHFAAGSLVALMGPSGCGKTTLLDILAKKKTSRYEGEVFVNGREVDHLYPRISGYVDSSDDAMPPHWTVRDAVTFNALLKNPWPRESVGCWAPRRRLNKLVMATLQTIGLLSVANTKIGGPSVRGISSGQRRRVMLARGLHLGAHLLFCDEPTSGLSATDAELCVKVLKILSKKWNVTVVVVIHQPRIEVARLFDHLVLLTSRPGRVVYNGPMADAAAYWTRLGFPVPAEVTPTDHFLDMITPDAPRAQPDIFVLAYEQDQSSTIDGMVRNALASPGRTAMELLQHLYGDIWSRVLGKRRMRNSAFTAGSTKQVLVLMQRKVRLMMVDPALLILQFLTPLLVSVFEGGICNYNIRSKGPVAEFQFLTVVLMTTIFLGLPNVPNLFEEKAIMEAEVADALYNEWAHLVVTLVVSSLVTVIRSSLYGVVMFAFARLPWSDFLPFWWWLTLLALVVDPVFSAAAAAANGTQSAMLGAMAALILLLISSGTAFATKITAPGLGFLFFVSPACRVAEQLVQAVFHDDVILIGFIRQQIGLEPTSPLACICCCLGFAAIFVIIQAACLLLNKQRAK